MVIHVYSVLIKMDLIDVIDLYAALPETVEETPFGPDVLVYKVCGKMFATASPDEVPARINVKCDPEKAVELREKYESILPGYHMNKKHWNTILLNGGVPQELLKELIKHSYQLVVKGLKKEDRERLLLRIDSE